MIFDYKLSLFELRDVPDVWVVEEPILHKVVVNLPETTMK